MFIFQEFVQVEGSVPQSLLFSTDESGRTHRVAELQLTAMKTDFRKFHLAGLAHLSQLLISCLNVGPPALSPRSGASLAREPNLVQVLPSDMRAPWLDR